MLPLPMEARAELDNIQEIMEGINLEAMGTDEWILCWGDTDFKPKKFLQLHIQKYIGSTMHHLRLENKMYHET